MAAILMGISYDEAKAIVHRVRNTKLYSRSESSMQGEWIHRVLSGEVRAPRLPTGFACLAADLDDAIVHATTTITGCTEPICRWKQGDLQSFRGITHTFGSIEHAFRQLGGKFCPDCKVLLKASLRVQVQDLYG